MYQISVAAPQCAGNGDITVAGGPEAVWTVRFDGDEVRAPQDAELSMDELDILELAIAKVRAQCQRPRLLWTVDGVSGHRFENGDAIGFTGQVRQYDDGGPAVIVTSGGDRFPFDTSVEVTTAPDPADELSLAERAARKQQAMP